MNCNPCGENYSAVDILSGFSVEDVFPDLNIAHQYNQNNDSLAFSLTDRKQSHLCKDGNFQTYKHELKYVSESEYSETPHASGMTTGPTVTVTPKLKISEEISDDDDDYEHSLCTSEDITIPDATPGLDFWDYTDDAGDGKQSLYVLEGMRAPIATPDPDISDYSDEDDDDYDKQSLYVLEGMRAPIATPDPDISDYSDEDDDDYDKQSLYVLEGMSAPVATPDPDISDYSDEDDDDDKRSLCTSKDMTTLDVTPELVVSEETENKVI